MSGEPLSPFTPFQPQGAALLVLENQPVQETAKEKKAREKREAAAKVSPSVPNPAPEKPARQKRTLKTHAPKFDLQTTLAAAKMLNEDDFALFEKAVVMFDEVGKPQRDRVLAAIGKVFG